MWFIQLVVVSHYADYLFGVNDWLVLAYPMLSVLIAVGLTFVIFRIILWIEVLRLWFIDNVDNSRKK